MSWFRQALDDTEPLFRFLKIWIAVEALNPALDNHYEIPPDDRRGFQGLRRLAGEAGLGDKWVSDAQGLRRELFHAFRVVPTELRARADRLVGAAENLCIAGWRTILGLAETFPDRSVVPHPLQLEVHAVVIQREPSAWAIGSHPYLEARPATEKVDTGEPGDVTFKWPITFTVRNAPDGLRLTGTGLWGPTGYEAVTLVEGPEVEPGVADDERLQD